MTAQKPVQTAASLRHRGFTLIELVAVVVILAVLGGIALPKYFNHSANAKDAADKGALGGMNTAMQMAYMDHRMRGSNNSLWITSVDDIVDAMETGKLPEGWSIDGAELVDQRGNNYTLQAETATASARLVLDAGGGGGGGGS